MILLFSLQPTTRRRTTTLRIPARSDDSPEARAPVCLRIASPLSLNSACRGEGPEVPVMPWTEVTCLAPEDGNAPLRRSHTRLKER